MNLAEIYWQHVDAVERLVRLGFSLPDQGLSFPGIREPAEQRDLVQDVFVRAFAPTAKYDPTLPLRPYLLRIAKNLLIDRARRLRRDAKKLPMLQSEIENHVEGPEVEDSPEFQSQAKVVADFVAALGEPDKSVIQKRFVDGLSQYEVATELGLTRGKVRAIEETVRKKLQPKLAVFRRSGMKYTFLALCLLACAPLPRNQTTACEKDDDCANGRYCVNATCQDMGAQTHDNDEGKACATHFECDAETICVDHKCAVFTPITYVQAIEGFYSSYCLALGDICSNAVMQKNFGSDPINSCTQGFKSMYGQYGNFGAPSGTNIDGKMAAACVVDLRAQARAGHAEQTFGNLPLSCSRMNPGALKEGEDCYMKQAQCEHGLTCAFGPTTGYSTPDYLCLKAFGKLGEECVTADGKIQTLCDLGLYCDTGSRQCATPKALGASCSAEAACDTSTMSIVCSQRSSSFASQCVYGAKCRQGTCVEAVAECPLN